MSDENQDGCVFSILAEASGLRAPAPTQSSLLKNVLCLFIPGVKVYRLIVLTVLESVNQAQGAQTQVKTTQSRLF